MAHTFDPPAAFPPVTTAEWEAQIARDLKGADYEKRLVWRTDEGIAVRPYYRAEHVAPRPPIVNAAGTWEMVSPGAEPAADASAIDAHELGATAVQEVAYVLAQGADALAAGRTVTTLAFAIGSNHFMEIAKLRAARAAVEGRGRGLRRRRRRAHPRADRGREQDALRPAREHAAGHHRGAVGDRRRLRFAHDHAVRVRRAPRGERAPPPPRGEPSRQGVRIRVPARTTSRR